MDQLIIIYVYMLRYWTFAGFDSC